MTFLQISPPTLPTLVLFIKKNSIHRWILDGWFGCILRMGAPASFAYPRTYRQERCMKNFCVVNWRCSWHLPVNITNGTGFEECKHKIFFFLIREGTHCRFWHWAQQLQLSYDILFFMFSLMANMSFKLDVLCISLEFVLVCCLT